MPLATVKPEFIVEKQGQAFAKFAGLLDAAHRSGLLSIVTNPLQFPTADNGKTALFFCTVKMLGDDGYKRTYTGTGDASPENCSPSMALCLPRLAETRSKARALRDAINFAGCALEELYDQEDPDKHGPTPARPNAPQSRQVATGSSSRRSATNSASTSRTTQKPPIAPKVQEAQRPSDVVAQAMQDAGLDNKDTEENRKIARVAFRDAAETSGIDPEALHSVAKLKALCVALMPALAQVKLVDMTTAQWRELKRRLLAYVADPSNPVLPGMTQPAESDNPTEVERLSTVAAIAR